MKYILQINTGNLNNINYKAEDIIKKIEFISNHLSISKVIFGWNNDKDNNRKISNYLKNKKIESYFWLPIFSEITDLSVEDKYIETHLYEKYNNKISNGDFFNFVCQSSDKNVNYIIDKFNEISKDVYFDGVFLDRIRYNSPALSLDAIYGCQCNNCKTKYSLPKNIYDRFTISSFDNGVYSFRDNDVNKMMIIKRNIITEQVKRICIFLKNNNYKVGLDTFAPCLSDFVGQDIISLNEYADFIKPMFYLKTTAPAGIPFELNELPNNIKDQISNIWKVKLDTIDGTIRQCQYLIDKQIKMAPGIDINHIENICNSNDEYVLKYICKLKQIDCPELVLSWDAMKISNELVLKVADIK